MAWVILGDFLRFYYHHLAYTSADGLLVPEVIIRPVVNASALIWVIKYIYYWNLQFLNNVIINKTMVLLSEAYVTVEDFDYSD